MKSGIEKRALKISESLNKKARRKGNKHSTTESGEIELFSLVQLSKAKSSGEVTLEKSKEKIETSTTKPRTLKTEKRGSIKSNKFLLNSEKNDIEESNLNLKKTQYGILFSTNRNNKFYKTKGKFSNSFRMSKTNNLFYKTTSGIDRKKNRLPGFKVMSFRSKKMTKEKSKNDYSRNWFLTSRSSRKPFSGQNKNDVILKSLDAGYLLHTVRDLKNKLKRFDIVNE